MPADCPIHGGTHAIGACRELARLQQQGGTAIENNWNTYIGYVRELDTYNRAGFLSRLFKSKPKRVKPPRSLFAPTRKHARIRREMKKNGTWK